MAESNTQDKSNAPWQFFSSVKLTIALLIILAIASILGTLIPQREDAIGFARQLSPETFRIFSWLNLFDTYHSIWFRVLLGCLSLNLIVCSIDRFPKTWKRVKSSTRPDRSKPFENMPADQSFGVDLDVEESYRKVSGFLNKRLGKTSSKASGEQHFLFAEKGQFSHMGVYLVHLSVLLILLGGLSGSFFGFEGYVNIAEGEQINTVSLRKQMDRLKLGFEVRCDKFKVDFYDNGAPKEYRSDVSFIVDNKVVQSSSILVNHPIRFRGITFYQSNYGTLPGKLARLGIYGHTNRNDPSTIEVELEKPVELPGREGLLRMEDVKGDFMKMGPAVLLSIEPKNGEKTRFWIFKDEENIRKHVPGLMERFPKLNPSSFKPYTFRLEWLESRHYTGLQVNKDPGVPVVWTGCFLMVAGFFVTFFTSHRKFWVRVSKERQGSLISVAGTSNKNPVGLEREIKKLTGELQNHLSLKG